MLMRLILKNRYASLNVSTIRILVATFNEIGIYFSNLTLE